MASTLGHLLRRTLQPKPYHHRLHLPLRSLTTKITHPSQYGPPRPHEHTNPSTFLSTWKDPPPTSDPRDALRRLEDLRKDYSRKVSACRKEYMYEVEVQRLEKITKDQARREAARVAREELKAAKREADVARAEKHKAFREELKQILMKEKTEKLEYWKAKEASRGVKKREREELLRNQSSMWIDESHLEKKIRDSLIDVMVL